MRPLRGAVGDRAGAKARLLSASTSSSAPSASANMPNMNAASARSGGFDPELRQHGPAVRQDQHRAPIDRPPRPRALGETALSARRPDITLRRLGGSPGVEVFVPERRQSIHNPWEHASGPRLEEAPQRGSANERRGHREDKNERGAGESPQRAGQKGQPEALRTSLRGHQQGALPDLPIESPADEGIEPGDEPGHESNRHRKPGRPGKTGAQTEEQSPDPTGEAATQR